MLFIFYIVVITTNKYNNRKPLDIDKLILQRMNISQVINQQHVHSIKTSENDIKKTIH